MPSTQIGSEELRAAEGHVSGMAHQMGGFIVKENLSFSVLIDMKYLRWFVTGNN
jgi:hypothetical protein